MFTISPADTTTVSFCDSDEERSSSWGFAPVLGEVMEGFTVLVGTDEGAPALIQPLDLGSTSFGIEALAGTNGGFTGRTVSVLDDGNGVPEFDPREFRDGRAISEVFTETITLSCPLD